MKLCPGWQTAPHGCGLSNANGCIFCRTNIKCPQCKRKMYHGKNRDYICSCGYIGKSAKNADVVQR